MDFDNSPFRDINIGDINVDAGTKGLPRKGEPANFPNNLNRTRTGAVKFFGRDGDLKILHKELQEKERVSITAVVTGMAGVGKTELALQYALFISGEINLSWWHLLDRGSGKECCRTVIRFCRDSTRAISRRRLEFRTEA
ncbi:MAG: hypothetical protein AAGJ08_09960 [Cyanobacteria bacterium P01_H01_bin.35]